MEVKIYLLPKHPPLSSEIWIDLLIRSFIQATLLFLLLFFTVCLFVLHRLCLIPIIYWEIAWAKIRLGNRPAWSGHFFCMAL